MYEKENGEREREREMQEERGARLVQPGWKVYDDTDGCEKVSGEVLSVFYKPRPGAPLVNSILTTHFEYASGAVRPVILYLSRKGKWKNALAKERVYRVVSE